MNQISTLKHLYKQAPNKKPFTWLKGRNYSDAFVICVGAGPWKFNRRKTIQKQALDRLNGKDLYEIYYNRSVNWYPLDWQNKFVDNMISNLHNKQINFKEFCKIFGWNRKHIYDFAGCPKGSKVLSLFCRDALEIPAFPIDRHVKRYLEQYNLPTKEDDMIEICEEAGLNPNKVAVAFVRTASDMDNPDWSI